MTDRLGQRDNPLHVTTDDQPAPTEVRLVERDDRRWWPLVVSVGASILSAILAATLCLLVSERNARNGRAARAELQRTQCAIVVALDEGYQAVPPVTATGKIQAQNMRNLRTSLNCQ